MKNIRKLVPLFAFVLFVLTSLFLYESCGSQSRRGNRDNFEGKGHGDRKGNMNGEQNPNSDDAGDYDIYSNDNKERKSRVNREIHPNREQNPNSDDAGDIREINNNLSKRNDKEGKGDGDRKGGNSNPDSDDAGDNGGKSEN